MSTAHYVLLLIAVVMAAESLWAIATPAGMRDRVRGLLDETGGSTRSWRTLLWGLALLLWLFAWFGQQWAHRALFLIGVFFMATGFLARRPLFLESWYGLFLGRRSPTGIRFIYLAELVLAAGFAWIAFTGQ